MEVKKIPVSRSNIQRSSICDKCSEKLHYEVEKCINFAAKVASNGKYLKSDHVTPLLKYLKWINFNSILQLNEASLIYKNLHLSADSNVKKIISDFRYKVTQRTTINGSDLQEQLETALIYKNN